MNDVPAAVSVPVLLGFLSLLGFVIKWLIERETTNAEINDKRISKLETDFASMSERQSEERRLKHKALNEAAALAMAARFLLASARRCTCGEMTSVVEMIDRTGVMEEIEHGR